MDNNLTLELYLFELIGEESMYNWCMIEIFLTYLLFSIHVLKTHVLTSRFDR